MNTEKKPHSMYFIGIVCPGELDQKVQQFKLWMLDHYGCRAALRAQSHITLIPPFWYNDENEDELLKSISAYSSSAGSQEIWLRGFSHFAKRTIFIQVLLNSGLTLVREETVTHFQQRLGETIKKDDRPFIPHVTIATRDMKPSVFNKAWEHFSELGFDESFNSSSISLLKLYPERWKVIAEKNWLVP